MISLFHCWPRLSASRRTSLSPWNPAFAIATGGTFALTMTTFPSVVQAATRNHTASRMISRKGALGSTKPRVTTLRLREHIRRPRTNITLELPQLQGQSASTFNAAVRSATSKQVAAFKSDVGEYSKNPPAPPYDKGSNTLQVTYQVKFANPRYISVLMSEFIDFPGAAHPSSGTYMLSYDLRAQRPLGLADLFKPGTPYLGTIARYCQPVLRQNLGDNPDPVGLKPTPQNFAHWNLTRSGLLIIFDPYQVAPYAAGPQNVTVPYDKLHSLMRPEVLAALRE